MAINRLTGYSRRAASTPVNCRRTGSEASLTGSDTSQGHALSEREPGQHNSFGPRTGHEPKTTAKRDNLQLVAKIKTMGAKKAATLAAALKQEAQAPKKASPGHISDTVLSAPGITQDSQRFKVIVDSLKGIKILSNFNTLTTRLLSSPPSKPP